MQQQMRKRMLLMTQKWFIKYKQQGQITKLELGENFYFNAVQYR